METYLMVEARSAEEDLDIDLDLAEIMEEYANRIVKYCYNLLWNFHDAQDAAQEVFLRAAEKMDQLRNSGSAAPWLYRIAYNVCIDMLRRKKREYLFVRRESVRQREEVHEDSYDYGISRELQAAMDALNPKDRALVYSRVVDDMEYSQLEAIYGAKSAALRKRYERALRKLAKRLKEGE